MVSSLAGVFSAATAAPKDNIAKINALRFIFSGHCTPVECIQERLTLAPVHSRLHLQLQENLFAEQALHLLARQRTNLLQHSASGADEDALLSLLLDVDGGHNVSELRFVLPEIHQHRYRVGN